MKMVKLIVVLGLIIVGLIVYSKYGKSSPTPAPSPEVTAQEMQKKQNAENDKPRVEEKYGFTSRQPGE